MSATIRICAVKVETHDAIQPEKNERDPGHKAQAMKIGPMATSSAIKHIRCEEHEKSNSDCRKSRAPKDEQHRT